MKRWRRIMLVVFVLIGGTASFGYWSFHEFDSVFSDLGNLSANLASTYNFTEPKVKVIASSTPEIALPTSILGTSTEKLVSSEEATSTLSISTYPEVATSTLSTPTNPVLVTTTLEATSSEPLVVKTFNKKEFRFVFPSRKNSIYIGCTYDISWLSSTTIQTMGISLVDAGTLKVSGPIASGISRENAIDPDKQNIRWEVGKVWPGRYYIQVSMVNGTSTDTTSQAFTIKDIPNGTTISKQKQLCEASGGVF